VRCLREEALLCNLSEAPPDDDLPLTRLI